MALSFHLCQPGAGGSCGACCGQYNLRDHRRSSLTRALARRTEVLSALPRDLEAWRRAARALKRWDRAVIFDPVRICPLLGFLDAAQSRVGCLGHPEANEGVDLRDCGVWSAEVCEAFECPSFLWLTDAQAALVRAACPDWYVYGLTVTDAELVRGFMTLVERRLGGAVDPARMVAAPAALAAAGALFALKAPSEDEPPAIRLGRFDRDDLGEPVARTLDYTGLGAEPAPEDDVVLCLGRDPATPEALEAAREAVRVHVARVAAALGSEPDPG